MTDRELMQMALDAIEQHLRHHEHGCVYLDGIPEALRARLTQPEPEPVVWIDNKQTGNFLNIAPPQREWQGLTDEEIFGAYHWERLRFARAIEAKLKEKNA